MPMSKSASSSPTPRSTSRVMMMGLIGSDERTVGLVHRTTTGARLVFWNPADGILPKNLAYPTDGRVRTVTTFYRVPHTISLDFPLLKICGSSSHSALPRDVDW